MDIFLLIQMRWPFLWRKSYGLWTHILARSKGLKWKHFNYGLVDYCDGFISCLTSHSDGTHSLQRIHWWESDIMLNFSKPVLMKKQSHLHLGLNFQQIFIFGSTIPLIWRLVCLTLTSQPSLYRYSCQVEGQHPPDGFPRFYRVSPPFCFRAMVRTQCPGQWRGAGQGP